MGLGLVCYVNRFSVLSPFLTSWKGQTLNICSFTHVSSVLETFFVLSNDFSLLFLQCSSGTSKGLSLSSDIFLLDLSCRRGLFTSFIWLTSFFMPKVYSWFLFMISLFVEFLIHFINWFPCFTEFLNSLLCHWMPFKLFFGILAQTFCLFPYLWKVTFLF